MNHDDEPLNFLTFTTINNAMLGMRLSPRAVSLYMQLQRAGQTKDELTIEYLSDVTGMNAHEINEAEKELLAVDLISIQNG